MQFRVQFEPAWRRALAPDDRRFWLLWAVGFRIYLRAVPVWEFTVYWKRLLTFTAILALGGYFGTVSVIHWRWRQLPENRVRWIDLALAPVRWEQLRHKRGETAIATGLRELEQGKIGPAVFNLRAGIARAPDDVRARLVLSEILALAGDSTEAVKIVEQGLAHTPLSADLINRLVLYHVNSGSWTRLLAFTDELLAPSRQPPLPPELRARVVVHRIRCLLQLERPAQALAALNAEPPAVGAIAQREQLRLRLEILQKLGRPDEVRALLASAAVAAAERGAPGDELAIARASGDSAAIESALRRLRAAQPDSLDPLLTAFRTWHELGRTTLSEAVAAEIAGLYAQDENALQRFAKLLIELDRGLTLDRLRAAAARQNLNPFAFDVGLTEIALYRGQWDEAVKRTALWEAQIGALPEGQRAYPEFVRRLVAAAATGGSGEVAALLTHLEAQRQRFAPSVFLRALRVLDSAGRVPAALDVARLGVRRFDGNDQLRAAEARLATLDAVRTSVVAGPPAARGERSSAEFEGALREIDTALASGRLDAAATAIRAWKTSAPTPSRDEDHAVALREIRLASLQQDAPAARFLIRRFLDRFSGTEDALALLALAKELKQAGRAPAAELLQSEVATARLSQPEVAAALTGQGFSGDNNALVSAAETRRSIDEAFARGDYAKVPQLVRLVRRAAPDWLPELAPELGLAEMRARALAGELPSASFALRELLLRPAPNRAALWATIRLVAREGRPDAARSLAEEAVRLAPDDTDARDLLAELRAGPGDAKR